MEICKQQSDIQMRHLPAVDRGKRLVREGGDSSVAKRGFDWYQDVGKSEDA